MKAIINRLADGENLNFEESKAMFEAFLDGTVNESEMASVLTALKIKGESAEEIAGAATALKGRTSQTEFEYPVIDTCGTGGDGSGSFNISTAAAFVAAGAGIKVAKHGNRSVTSKSGSADVLEALTVKVDLTETQSLESLESTGLGFFYAPSIHKSMKSVMPVRRALGFRTIFNLIGPLCNPVKLTAQIIGVGDSTKLDVMAEAGRIMGLRQTLFVCSENGLDELTLEGTNQGILVNEGKKSEMKINASELGFVSKPDKDLKGGTASDNAKIMSSVLLGAESAHKDAVVLNAGTALYIGELAQTIEEGIELANQSIAEGKALLKLEALRKSTFGENDIFNKKDTSDNFISQDKYMSNSDLIENLKERSKTVNRLVGM